MKRREFMNAVAAGAGALSGASMGPRPAMADPGHPETETTPQYVDAGYQAPEWLRYARAIYFDGYSPPVFPHLNHFDAKRLVECAIELGGDCLRFQPLGYFAYFQSESLPMHPELGRRDLIVETAEECRKQGIHIFCYISYGYGFMPVEWVDQHPEYAAWIQKDAQGNAVGTGTHIGWGPNRNMCALGDAYRNGMRQAVEELAGYDIDGVYFDAPSTRYYSVCYCDTCRANFRSFSGMDLDRLQKGSDREASLAWYAWANQCCEEDMLRYREILHGQNKFMLCHNGGTWTGSALPLQYRIPDGFMIEHCVQTHERLYHGLLGAAMARPYQKLPLMYLNSYCLSNFGQPVHNRPWAVHNTNLEDSEEILMEGFANLASGGCSLYATANRRYFNVGGGDVKYVREVYDCMKRFEPFHKDSVPVPYVTVLPSWESLQTWRTGEGTSNFQMGEALTLAMLDARVSIDVVPTTEMTETWLNTQRVVALCGATGVSDEQAQLLGVWVKRGGALLATYDTGLFDERGEIRTDGGALREILGVEMYEKAPGSAPECYFRLLDSLGPFKPGDILQGDGRTVRVKVRSGARVLAESWNLGTDEVRGPAIVWNDYGKGRAAYISGSLEAHYISSRVRTNRELLAALVQMLGGEPMPFELEAPLGVYGVLRRSVDDDLLLWILAPIGFKDAAIGRMCQEFVPVPEVTVRIRIPDGRKVRSVRLERADCSVPYHLEEGYVITTLERVHVAEIVHVEFET